MTTNNILSGLPEIKLEAVRIPNRSGSYDNKDFPNSFHWTILLNGKFVTEYSEGIGHFINTNHHLYNKLITERIVNRLLACEKVDVNLMSGGITQKEFKDFFTSRITPKKTKGSYLHVLEVTPPKLEDILYSLTMDADAVNYSFEDWCATYDYDTDSRKALETWHECTNSYRKLKALGLDLEDLQNRFQDY